MFQLIYTTSANTAFRAELDVVKKDLADALVKIDQLGTLVRDSAVKTNNDLKVARENLSGLEQTVTSVSNDNQKLQKKVGGLESAKSNQRQNLRDVKRRVNKMAANSSNTHLEPSPNSSPSPSRSS